MQFRHPLDTILDSSVKVRILRFFCRKGGVWNGRRLAAALSLNPVTAHTALRDLHEATVLEFHKVGNNFVYSLRDDHYLVRDLLRPLFRRESQAREALVALVRKGLGRTLRSGLITVAIYGSLARGHERPTSDIDVVVLVKSKAASRAIRQALDGLWEPVMQRFGNTLALYVNTLREAQQKSRRRLPVFQDILRCHHLVWGRPLEEALRGRPA